MADFGLPILVTDQLTQQPIAGAVCIGTVCALDANNEPITAVTNPDGKAVISGLYLTVNAPGYHSYMNQLYRRPSLQAPVTVSLQRRT